MEKIFPSGAVLKLMEGDITRVAVDAIVNAANASLAGGGGVDGAIHRAGGPTLMRELDEIRKAQGGCATGSAVVTGAGKLPARWVFHAVGPVYRDGRRDEPRLLASCHSTCLRLADEHGAASISFPAISTGVYGYPLDDAARVSVGAVAEYLNAAQGTVREVVFVLFGERALRAFSKALDALR